jgi:hypothetical protein
MFIARLLFVTSILLVVGEVVTRLFITSPAGTIPDAEIGWVYKPHTKIFHTHEGWAVNEINSLGFNDRELIVAQDKREVLVLGDSYTEALQVPQSENFTSLAEIEVPCVDVINAGRSGLSPVQYDVLSKRFFKAVPISQVIAVLNVSDMQDILNSDAELARGPTGDIIDIKLHERKLTGLRQALDVVFSNSALANYLKNRIRASLQSKGKGKAGSVGAESDQKDAAEKLNEVLGFIFNKINKKAPLGIIFVPSLEYLPKGEVRQKIESASFERILEGIAKTQGIPYLSSREYLAQSYKENVRPPVGFPNSNMVGGHLNEFGHRSVKAALVQLIGKGCHSTHMLSTNLPQQ